MIYDSRGVELFINKKTISLARFLILNEIVAFNLLESKKELILHTLKSTSGEIRECCFDINKLIN